MAFDLACSTKRGTTRTKFHRFHGHSINTVADFIHFACNLMASKAREYNTILAKQREIKSLSNEIVVAYRQNASPRFPIIGIPVDGGDWYEVQDNQKAYYHDAAIRNSWRKTVELPTA